VGEGGQGRARDINRECNEPRKFPAATFQGRENQNIFHCGTTESESDKMKHTCISLKKPKDNK